MVFVCEVGANLLGQAISADVFVWVGIDEGGQDQIPAFTLRGREVQAVQLFCRFVKVAEQGLALKDLGDILVALQKTTPFQLGNRGFDFGIGEAIVKVKRGVDCLGTEQFAGGEDDSLAGFLLLQTTDAPEEVLDVPLPDF